MSGSSLTTLRHASVYSGSGSDRELINRRNEPTRPSTRTPKGTRRPTNKEPFSPLRIRHGLHFFIWIRNFNINFHSPYDWTLRTTCFLNFYFTRSKFAACYSSAIYSTSETDSYVRSELTSSATSMSSGMSVSSSHQLIPNRRSRRHVTTAC